MNTVPFRPSQIRSNTDPRIVALMQLEYDDLSALVQAAIAAVTDPNLLEPGHRRRVLAVFMELADGVGA